MTQIDFYILPDDNSLDALTYACRLIEKVYRLGHDMYIHCGDEATCQYLDNLLWQHGAESFLAHARADQNPACSPVVLGCQEPPAEHGEIMVNLSGDIPAFFSRFRRVAEIVPGKPDDRTKSRQNYLFYKERGYPLKTHNIQPTTR